MRGSKTAITAKIFSMVTQRNWTINGEADFPIWDQFGLERFKRKIFLFVSKKKEDQHTTNLFSLMRSEITFLLTSNFMICCHGKGVMNLLCTNYSQLLINPRSPAACPVRICTQCLQPDLEERSCCFCPTWEACFTDGLCWGTWRTNQI